MPRTFAVPSFYRSPAVLAVKQARREQDPRKRDQRPTILDFGPVTFYLARHFGFCFGVENAIETAYRVLAENPGCRIFLLSEMIHNPQVNTHLQERGIQFLMKTDGTRLINFSTLCAEDIVVVPAFGTTLELQQELSELGIDPYRYDATCPFVQKVWNRADQLGDKGFTVVIHGKQTHEETRATFSHSRINAPTLVIRDLDDAQFVTSVMKGESSAQAFEERFAESISSSFNPRIHLQKIGVVNQTTMLASETQSIAAVFRQTMIDLYGEDSLGDYFADTRDTLCYATNENQSATIELTKSGAQLALVVGGYNSSNTSHLVELCEQQMPTYFIKNAEEIIDRNSIRHFNLHSKSVQQTKQWLPELPVKIAVTAGASCPDRAVDQVIRKVLGFFPNAACFDSVIESASSSKITT